MFIQNSAKFTTEKDLKFVPYSVQNTYIINAVITANNAMENGHLL